MNNELKREQLKAAILGEVFARQQELDVNTGQHLLFNNFDQYLPKGSARINAHKFFSENPEHQLIFENERKIKPDDFFNIIDALIAKLGINHQIEEQASVMNYNYASQGENYDPEKYSKEAKIMARRKLQDIIIPLYVELRLQGFTMQDLCR